jgi:hypothetical protein
VVTTTQLQNSLEFSCPSYFSGKGWSASQSSGACSVLSARKMFYAYKGEKDVFYTLHTGIWNRYRVSFEFLQRKKSSLHKENPTTGGLRLRKSCWYLRYPFIAKKNLKTLNGRQMTWHKGLHTPKTEFSNNSSLLHTWRDC